MHKANETYVPLIGAGCSYTSGVKDSSIIKQEIIKIVTDESDFNIEKFDPEFDRNNPLKNRIDSFKTRQRIYECLKNLRGLRLITKNREKYMLNAKEVCFHALTLDHKIDLTVFQEVELESDTRNEIEKFEYEGQLAGYIDFYLLRLVTKTYSDRVTESRKDMEGREERLKKT